MKRKKTLLILNILLFGFFVSNCFFNAQTYSTIHVNQRGKYSTTASDRLEWNWRATQVISPESFDTVQLTTLDIDSAGNIHVAWQDRSDYLGSGVDIDILYKRWNTTSLSWSTAEVVSTESTSWSEWSSLAVDPSGNVHIAWEDSTNYTGAGTDTDIFYKRWNATSLSWSLTEVVSTESSSDSEIPSLAVDFVGNVHIAWEDLTNYGAGPDKDIFYKRWNATSLSWSLTEVVSTESTEYSVYTSLAVDYIGDVHIAWMDFTNYASSGTDPDVFYKRYNSLFSSWTLTEIVSTESTDWSEYPFLTTDSAGNIHVAWADETNIAGSGTDEDIFYKRLDATFSSWTTSVVISTESTTLWSRCPVIDVDSANNIHIAWYDYTDYAGAGGDADVFYKRLDATLSLWTLTEVISTEGFETSGNPSIAVDTSGTIHIVWHDSSNYADSGSDSDVFYRKYTSPLAPPDLAFIDPNPSITNDIFLNWNEVVDANIYHVFRSSSYIWSVDELNPLTTISLSEFNDNLPSEGIYYYVIVASDGLLNSSCSNCQYIEYKLPQLHEFEIVLGLIGGLSILFIVITTLQRRKKNKQI